MGLATERSSVQVFRLRDAPSLVSTLLVKLRQVAVQVGRPDTGITYPALWFRSAELASAGQSCSSCASYACFSPFGLGRLVSNADEVRARSISGSYSPHTFFMSALSETPVSSIYLMVPIYLSGSGTCQPVMPALYYIDYALKQSAGSM